MVKEGIDALHHPCTNAMLKRDRAFCIPKNQSFETRNKDFLKSKTHLLLLLSLGGGALDREVALLGNAGSVGLLGNLGAIPLGRGDGVDVEDVHGVDLLERTVLGLDDEEVDNNGKTETATTEDETEEPVDRVDDDGREERNQEVPDPVGGSGETHAGGTVAGRVQLSDDGPDKGSPGGGERDDEQAGEDNQHTAGSRVVGGGVGRKLEPTDESVDHETDESPESTSNKSLAATTLSNNIETTESANNVDGTENDLSDVGVAETGGLEDGGSIVEEEVGTGKLLTSLEGHTENGTVGHTGTSEALVPLGTNSGSLLIELDADVVDLVVDLLVVRVDTSVAGNDVASLVLTTGTVSVTGRLGQEKNTNTEDEGPEERDTVGDSPLSAVAVGIVGAVVDHVRGPDTEGDKELVAGDENTTDDTRSGLSLVHGDDNGKSTNADTVDETASGELAPGSAGRDLDDDTDGGPEGKERDGVLAANDIGKSTSDKRTNSGTTTEEGSDCALAVGAEDVGTIALELTEALKVVGHLEVTFGDNVSHIFNAKHSSSTYQKFDQMHNRT